MATLEALVITSLLTLGSIGVSGNTGQLSTTTGDTVLIPCDFGEGTVRNLYWYYNDGTGPVNILTLFKGNVSVDAAYAHRASLHDDSSTLILTDIMVEDEGTYRCDVDREGQTAVPNINTNLHVFSLNSHNLPEIAQCTEVAGKSSACNVYTNKSITMNCALSGVYPAKDAGLVWYRDEQRVHSTDSSKENDDGTVDITAEIEVSESGNLTCNATFLTAQGAESTVMPVAVWIVPVPDSPNTPEKGLSEGGIAGIAVVSVVIVVACPVIIFIILRRKREQRQSRQQANKGNTQEDLEQRQSEEDLETSRLLNENASKNGKEQGQSRQQPNNDNTQEDLGAGNFKGKDHKDSKAPTEGNGSRNGEESKPPTEGNGSRNGEGAGTVEDHKGQRENSDNTQQDQGAGTVEDHKGAGSIEDHEGPASPNNGTSSQNEEGRKKSKDRALAESATDHHKQTSPLEHKPQTMDSDAHVKETDPFIIHGRIDVVEEPKITLLARNFPAGKFHEFCFHLDRKYNDADEVLNKHSKDCKKALLEILNEWKNDTGGHRSVLQEALKKAGVGGLRNLIAGDKTETHPIQDEVESPSQNGNPENNQDYKPSKKDFDDILKEVARKVCKDSEIDTLGRKLSFEPEDMQRYIASNHNTQNVTFDGTLQMLRDWRKRQTKSTERSTLKKALEQAELIHLADDLFPSNL